MEKTQRRLNCSSFTEEGFAVLIDLLLYAQYLQVTGKQGSFAASRTMIAIRGLKRAWLSGIGRQNSNWQRKRKQRVMPFRVHRTCLEMVLVQSSVHIP